MDCDLFRLMIQKYSDGELSPADKARFETHRAQCSGCRKAEEEFLDVFRALGGMHYYSPPERFDSLVMAKVDTARYRKNPAKKLLRDIQWKWHAIPARARLAGTLTAAFVFFMYVFRPVYLELLEVLRKAVLFLLSAVMLIRRVDDLYEKITDYLDSGPGFIVAARVLFEKSAQFVREIPAGYYVIAGLIMFLIFYMAFRLTGSSQRKGESHAGIY